MGEILYRFVAYEPSYFLPAFSYSTGVVRCATRGVPVAKPDRRDGCGRAEMAATSLSQLVRPTAAPVTSVVLATPFHFRSGVGSDLNAPNVTDRGRQARTSDITNFDTGIPVFGDWYYRSCGIFNSIAVERYLQNLRCTDGSEQRDHPEPLFSQHWRLPGTQSIRDRCSLLLNYPSSTSCEFISVTIQIYTDVQAVLVCSSGA